MPLQRVVDRDPRANEPLAVIDEQPQIELGPVQVRRRQRFETFTQRGAGDRERVDAVGLSAAAGLAPRAGRQRRVHAQDTLAALDQKPLQGARHMPAILDRPHPILAQAACPREQAGGPWRPTARSARRAARRTSLRPRRSCASACGCPHRARSWPSSTSTRLGWTPGGHGLLGAMPRSYQVTPRPPRPATSDTAKGSQTTRPTA